MLIPNAHSHLIPPLDMLTQDTHFALKPLPLASTLFNRICTPRTIITIVAHTPSPIHTHTHTHTSAHPHTHTHTPTHTLTQACTVQLFMLFPSAHSQLIPPLPTLIQDQDTSAHPHTHTHTHSHKHVLSNCTCLFQAPIANSYLVSPR